MKHTDEGVRKGERQEKKVGRVVGNEAKTGGEWVGGGRGVSTWRVVLMQSQSQSVAATARSRARVLLQLERLPRAWHDVGESRNHD